MIDLPTKWVMDEIGDHYNIYHNYKYGEKNKWKYSIKIFIRTTQN